MYKYEKYEGMYIPVFKNMKDIVIGKKPDCLNHVTDLGCMGIDCAICLFGGRDRNTEIRNKYFQNVNFGNKKFYTKKDE